MGCDPVERPQIAPGPPVGRAVHIGVTETIDQLKATPWGPVLMETWLEPDVRGDVRWAPAHRGHPVVTCTLTAPDGSIAIGTFRATP